MLIYFRGGFNNFSMNRIDCKYTTTETDSIPNNSHTELYVRDSLFIDYTIRQYINLEFDIFSYYKQWDIPLNKVSLYIDTIIYSPDSLKFISFLIQKQPDIEHNNTDYYFYSGSDMIAYRNSVNDLWNIYYFGEIRPSAYRYYQGVRKVFYDFYFGNGDFKDETRYYWDEKTKDRISIPFGYNLDNPLFWDSSIVWKRGSRINGYYSFQTKGNVTPKSIDPIIILPRIKYPEYILKSFSAHGR